MCFSSRGLRRVPWKAHGLVEDMEFALTLRVLGERVRFEPEARVFGEMVSKGGPGAASQRRRWEVGRRSLRGKFAGAIAKSPSWDSSAKSSYLLDLFFPSLATLALGLVAVSSVHALALVDARFVPVSTVFPVHAAMVAIFLVYVASPTVVMGLPARYLASLLALPYYVVWKIWVALGRPRRPGSGRLENLRHRGDLRAPTEPGMSLNKLSFFGRERKGFPFSHIRFQSFDP